MATKIKVELDIVAMIFPEANKIPFLPRKKKKALKKKISKQLVSMLEEDAKEIMERVNLLNKELFEDFASLKREMERMSIEKS